MTYRYVSNTALRIGQIALLVEAIMRGLNYVTTPQRAAGVLNQVEGSAPLWAWGGLFVGLGVLGLFGEALISGTEPYLGSYNPRAWPSFIAHSALMCAYLAISAGALVTVIQTHPHYGYLESYDMFGLALANWVFARRRRHV